MTGPTIFALHGRLFMFKSVHPLEERIVELPDDLLTEEGVRLPELVAWDGVETCGDIDIKPPNHSIYDDEED